MTFIRQNESDVYESFACNIDQVIADGTSVSDLLHAAFRMIHWIPVDIIDQVWPESEYGFLNGHFRSKYTGYCSKEGYASPNAILRFFAELDTTNSRLFCEFFARNLHKHLPSS